MLTKVILSTTELALVNNIEIILTKRNILLQVEALLNEQIPIINSCFSKVLIPYSKVITSAPKISRGENYLGLPYLMLDYPATFGKHDVFAVRTMFWWGNFMSISLLVQGIYKDAFADTLINALGKLLNNQVFVCIADNPWQHHFQLNNYVNYNELSAHQLQQINDQSFLKIAVQFDLIHFNEVQLWLTENYGELAKLLIS